MPAGARKSCFGTCTLLPFLLVGLCGGDVPYCSAGKITEDDVKSSGSHAEVKTLDPDTCLARAKEFIASHGKHPKPDGDPSKLLYFLHIPRTAGRTYHFCFLKQAHPPSRRCPKAYDALRLDERVEEACGLLSSHDDYSITDQLPEDAAFLTQLREPVGRVLSSYEFAHQVASNDAITQKAPRPTKGSKVDTRNVWPWSFLVPFLEEQMRERYPAALKEAEAVPKLSSQNRTLDPYSNLLTMPLRDFLNHPQVADTVHNGATLQVLGLTSYSQWPAAAELRRCLPSSKPAREALLQLALQRLDTFIHVGLFDRLEDSIVSLAATLGIDLHGPAWGNEKPKPQGDVAKRAAEQSDAAAEAQFPLWRSYHHCVDKARKKQVRRRLNSFQKIHLPNTERIDFSAATRAALDPSILEHIRELNSMDVALYERGKQLLESRIEEHRRQGRWQPLPSKQDADLKEMARQDAWKSRHKRGRAHSDPEAAFTDESGSVESGEDRDEL